MTNLIQYSKPKYNSQETIAPAGGNSWNLLIGQTIFVRKKAVIWNVVKHKFTVMHNKN